MLRRTKDMVYQSGLGVGRRGEIPLRQPLGGVYRAVVMAVHPTDDSITNPRGYQVLCDVILISTMTPLFGVPVALGVGTNDASIPWVPKPTTRTLSGEPLRLRAIDRNGNFEGPPTSFLDMDGDLVNVQFVEGSVQRPIITGRRPHQATRRRVVSGSGWENSSQDTNRGTPQLGEAYFRHSGTEVRVRKDGSLLVDTVGATEDEATEAPAAGGGEQRLRLKRGQRLVVAAGSVGGQGNAGGKDLLSLTQDALGAVELRAADGKFSISIDPLGNITADLQGGLRYHRIGPVGTLDLLSGAQPIALGPPLQVAASALAIALSTYTAAIAPVVDPTGSLTSALGTALSAFATQVASSLSATIKAE